MKYHSALFLLFWAGLMVCSGGKVITENCLKTHPSSPHVAGVDLDAAQKCTLECSFEEVRIMDSNGNINITRGLEVNKEAWPETASKYAPMYPGCLAKSKDVKDKCEKAYVYIKCFGQEAVDLIFT
uniref:Odorant binding protein 2 n=1 Tax=Pachypeltis micranthus TaxID=1983339 RepID=A0A1W6QYP7_9HEMI|nr:odorant binding protein 2 [Pachypeltis micranthus]